MKPKHVAGKAKLLINTQQYYPTFKYMHLHDGPKSLYYTHPTPNTNYRKNYFPNLIKRIRITLKEDTHTQE